jgi:predicted nucleic acid-binding protein
MILPDVNVLVYAHREDAVDHMHYRQWLEEAIRSGQPYGLSRSSVEWLPSHRNSPADF